MRIGFIGLGKMGAPMARRLGAADYEVRVFDLRPEAINALSGAPGLHPANSVADAVAGAELVITMLPDGAAVAAAVSEFGRKLAPGAILTDMSTADPAEAETVRHALPAAVEMVDAPVSGGVARAELGTLTIMAGGAATAVERIAPALSPLGQVYRTGALGSGRAMKLLNNYLSASGLAAACEAVAIGRAFGLDPDLMADVFNGSTGRNNATEVKMKQHVNSGAFASGFTMGLMAKDLRLGGDLADRLGVEAAGLKAMRALFDQGEAALGPAADHTEIARLVPPKE